MVLRLCFPCLMDLFQNSKRSRLPTKSYWATTRASASSWCVATEPPDELAHAFRRGYVNKNIPDRIPVEFACRKRGSMRIIPHQPSAYELLFSCFEHTQSP